uniref:F-box domain-containing protein n=1 Tax=Moniliophthora roreri TaxID=221103 RepID=A0A0W0FQH7_MONRR
MANINTLPTEILLLLIDADDTKSDLRALRAVNRSFESLVTPILFSVLRFSTGTREDLACVELLKSLGSPHSRISSHIRTIRILSQDAIFSRRWTPRAAQVQAPRAKSILGRLFERKPSDENQKVDVNEHAQRMQNLYDERIHNAVRSLINLSAVSIVHWVPYSLSHSSLWKALRQSNISLKEVAIHDGVADAECAVYLGSCTGLKKLLLTYDSIIGRCLPYEVDDKAEEHLSKSLLKTVLKKQAASLMLLSFGCNKEGPWSFGLDSIDHYARYIDLRVLRVCLNAEDLEQRPEILEKCLQMAHSLPHLNSLITITCTKSSSWVQRFQDSGRNLEITVGLKLFKRDSKDEWSKNELFPLDLIADSRRTATDVEHWMVKFGGAVDMFSG